MHPLLERNPGARRLLLGNEAIARGAIEAGVAYVTAYPGTPSTEISDALFRTAREAGHYFEYSTNEKVALEVAAGAAWGGRRAFTAMKQVGLNVAADPLMTLGAVGVIGGLVVVTADDPSQHSSQTEQDSRHYARLADVPMLEPASADEALGMTRYAFDLSEEIGFPVLLRTTTRLAHLRGVATFGPVASIRPAAGAPARDPRRFVNLPANAPANRARHLAALGRAAEISNASPWNVVSGRGTLGIVASGMGRAYAIDALGELGLADRVAVLDVGFSWPPPRDLLARFLRGIERLLVVEELEPFLEHEAELAAFRSGLRPEILGKRSGHFRVAGEFGPDLVRTAVADLAGVAAPRARGAPPAAPAAAPAPGMTRRPPVLCAGCGHRASFWAASVATGGRALFENDIGCYTLGYGPPFEQADHLICMGGGINTAAALSRQVDRPVFAYIGDSTFFHSGITGLINAVHNGYRFVVVVLDNLTTAMTGHQPHPAISERGGVSFTPVPIEDVVRACGVGHVEVTDAMDVGATVAAMRRAIAFDGVAVVVSRSPCALLRDAPARHAPRSYRVIERACCACGCTADGQPCVVPLDPAEKRFRSDRRLRVCEAIPSGDLPALAPCIAACPAGICAQGYVNHLACGRPGEALRLIRERVAFPGILGHVCHHPCEPACVRAGADVPIAINALKRFAAGFDDPPERHYLLDRSAAVPRTGRRVAVVGSGPAGLQCAYELRMLGHDVTVFERAPVAGGLLALGIPEHRLPRDVLRREIELLERLGVEIRLRAGVDRDLLTEGAGGGRWDAVFLAVGAGRTRALGIPGEDAAGVVDSLDLLEATALGRPFALGRRVVVVGGGNAAIDAARTARRGALVDVVVLYRRTEAEMPADRSEVDAAREEGVRFEFLSAPERIAVRDGRVAGVSCRTMRLGDPDASGRPRPVPTSEPPRVIECDTVVRAVGQRMDGRCARVFGAAVDGSGRVIADERTLATGRPGVFAGGDAVSGPLTVVDAIAAGKRAAWGIDVFLRGDSAVPLDLPPSRPPVIPVKGARAPRLAPGPAPAGLEASRCLACGVCAHCRLCVEMFSCPAISIAGGRVRIDEVSCNGCGVCAEICPNAAIEAVPRGEVRTADGGRRTAGGGRRTPPAVLRIVLAGVGGQGSLLASRVIGEAAVAAGYDVVSSELHGMSQRGGAVVSTVVIGSARGPMVADGDADVLVAFEPLEAVRALRACSAKTLAVVNSFAVPPAGSSAGDPPYPAVDTLLGVVRSSCGSVVVLDAQRIAEGAGNARAVNSAVLGALAATGILPFPADRLADAIRALVPADAAEAGVRAFEAGRGLFADD